MRCFFFISVKLVAKGGGGGGDTEEKWSHTKLGTKRKGTQSHWLFTGLAFSAYVQFVETNKK